MNNKSSSQITKEIGDITNFITNLDYPITKEDLLDKATQADLDPYFVEKIEQIPSETFENMSELSEAIGEAELL